MRASADDAEHGAPRNSEIGCTAMLLSLLRRRCHWFLKLTAERQRGETVTCPDRLHSDAAQLAEAPSTLLFEPLSFVFAAQSTETEMRDGDMP